MIEKVNDIINSVSASSIIRRSLKIVKYRNVSTLFMLERARKQKVQHF